jgi:hypothetical protein
MVKQLNDPGLKGAALIAIVPATPGHLLECSRKHDAGEYVFKDWDGYFGGVKHNLVFLFDSDGTDGGIYFSVFNSKTKEKVFRDSARIGNSYDGLDFVSASEGHMILRYVRVVSGECSLLKGGNACWSKFQARTGLRTTPIPHCDYQNENATTSSVIGYPVEVSLLPKPSIKALGGPVKCWPVD